MTFQPIKSRTGKSIKRRVLNMAPVIGLDVAKGESQVQAFLQRKETYKQSFKFTHDLPGLQSFHSFYHEVEKVSGQPPAIIFESTGHYQEPVLHFLEDNDIAYYLVNPVISFEARKTNLRQVKTDKTDAYHSGELYYKEDFEIYQKKTDKALNLRLLTRRHSALTDSYVQIKLQFQVALDRVFPEFHNVFSDLYGKLSLNTLLNYPTAIDGHKVAEEKLADEMRQFGARRSQAWFLDKARQLKEAAKHNPFQYQEHLSKLLKEINELSKSFEEYRLIQSVPGIGDKIAATIISEIGDINQFENPKKVVAYAGLDPSVFESGKFKASINRITKRGSSRLRHSLYMAVQCGLTKDRNKRLVAFYDRKRNEGKPHKVAVIACANKLVHWIYAMLKRQEVFVDQM